MDASPPHAASSDQSAAAPPDAGTLSADAALGEEPQWSSEELEAAYLRALDALDAMESEAVATAEEIAPGRWEELTTAETADATERGLAAQGEPDPTVAIPVSAEQIVEACLFVGGSALTAGKLAHVLKGDYAAEDVEQIIARLNAQYLEEARPYEIRLVEGGYRLLLRPEFDRIRHKVYGLGPKEVRLSQEALEVLAVVAYHQPVTEAQITELGRPNCGATLRLLLRRDLIVVDRDASQPRDIHYRTTPRFLSLFGIATLDDLPRPDDLLFK